MRTGVRLTRTVAVVAATTLAMVGLAAPSAHAAEPVSGVAEQLVVPASAPVRINPDSSAMPQVCAESPEGQVTCVDVSRDGSLAEGLPPRVLVTEGGEYGVDWTVGIGWYVYLYLNRNDVHWLISLGYAGASAAICAMLVSTIAGAFVCGAGAYLLWTVISDYAYIIPHGYCLELKFRFSLEGAKLVKRNC